MIKLPDSISSPTDITALIMEIRSYQQWYGQYANAARAKTAYHTPQPELSPIASEVIREWAAAEALTASRIDTLIAELEHTATSAPVITITLATAATAEVKRTLVAWCRTHIAADVLVAFRFNATILGGMVVRCGSRVYDWSFRTQLMNGRARFPEVLTHV
jgi:hypothetical protein